MASAPAEGTPTLELRDLSKALGSIIALRSAGQTLYPDPIHAWSSSTSESVIGTVVGLPWVEHRIPVSTHPFNRKSRSI